MPTPFYHLSLAEQVLNHQSLGPEIGYLIHSNRGAFYLGSTAPDVQVISGQKRSGTHFFKVPIPKMARVPWEVLIIKNPQLGAGKSLDLVKAVFVAGYLCHLQADWFWIKEIFEPIFGPHQKWGIFSKRLYWHNILRAYLDVQVIADLPVEQILNNAVVRPQNWLPFIQDLDLLNWWAYLCEQLQPGNNIKTVKVFAAREGIEVDEFQSMLESEQGMRENIFVHISPGQLADYRAKIVAHNVALVKNYLGPRIAPEQISL
ncbi:MAG: zinc dependent phospholipase C family protein [Anaerolineales bacterium]